MDRVEKYSRHVENDLKIKAKTKKKRKRAMILSQKIDGTTTHNCLTNEYNQHMIDRYDDRKTLQRNDEYNSSSSENSWLDLTECSTTNITEWGSGDKQLMDQRYINTNMNRLKDFYELKISNLLSIIEEIKEENILLKETISEKDKELQKSTISIIIFDLFY